jgi:hypothetical protein
MLACKQKSEIYSLPYRYKQNSHLLSFEIRLHRKDLKKSMGQKVISQGNDKVSNRKFEP